MSTGAYLIMISGNSLEDNALVNQWLEYYFCVVDRAPSRSDLLNSLEVIRFLSSKNAMIQYLAF